MKSSLKPPWPPWRMYCTCDRNQNFMTYLGSRWGGGCAPGGGGTPGGGIDPGCWLYPAAAAAAEDPEWTAGWPLFCIIIWGRRSLDNEGINNMEFMGAMGENKRYDSGKKKWNDSAKWFPWGSHCINIPFVGWGVEKRSEPSSDSWHVRRQSQKLDFQLDGRYCRVKHDRGCRRVTQTTYRRDLSCQLWVLESAEPLEELIPLNSSSRLTRVGWTWQNIE